MNKKQVEQKVNSGFTNATPDVYQSVSNDCRGCYGQATATARPNPRKIMPWRIATFALALILVAVVIVGSIGLHGEYASAATVSLDVNPSVQIKINGKQRVISAEGLNDEGKDIIGTMDLKGCQLEVAVNAIIGAMLRKGYLSDLANSVLVSVDSSKALYDQLVDKVTGEINLTMKDKDIEASVVAQWIKSDDAVAALAKKYDISVGKAQLIHKIASASDLYTEEQLVALSVNDLSILLGNIDIADDDDLTHSGTASDKTYLGVDEALKIALAKLGMEGLTAESEGLTVKESKLDYEDGLMVYDIEFEYGAFEYEVLVGAFSGKVLSFECQAKGEYNPDTDQEKLDEAAIINKALQQAKVAEEDLTALQEQAICTRSGYYRIEVYSVFFEYNTYFYECEIDCYGNVLYYASIATDLSADDVMLARCEVENYVRENAHKYIAAIDDSPLTVFERMRVITKENEGNIYYEVTFVCDGVEYVCNVDAATKAIVLVESNDYEDIVDDAMHNQFGDKFDGGWLGWDEIWHEDFWQDDFGHGGHGDHHFGGQPVPPQIQQLTEEEVKEIVAWMFDLRNLDGVTDWKCELEQGRNGMDVYEVEFALEGVNYELKVNAVTGSVMRVDYEYAR